MAIWSSQRKAVQRLGTRSTGLESQALPPVAFLGGHSAPLGLRLLCRVCISGSLWLKGELNAKRKKRIHGEAGDKHLLTFLQKKLSQENKQSDMHASVSKLLG